MNKRLFGIDITRHYELSKSDNQVEHQADVSLDNSVDKSLISSKSVVSKSVKTKIHGKMPLAPQSDYDDVKTGSHDVVPLFNDDVDHAEYF